MKISELGILRLHGFYICKACYIAHLVPYGLVYNHSKICVAGRVQIKQHSSFQ